MRIFQFHTFYIPYLNDFNQRFPEAINVSYQKRLEWILNDRFHATHILQPVYDQPTEAKFAIANDPHLQLQWAKEHQFKETNYKKILLAQIEEHRPDVVYSLSPIIYDSAFVRSLPGCVKVKICWLASNMYKADLSAYDAVTCNFPTMLKSWKEKGLRTAWFSPSFDPAMDDYAARTDRPIDISFVGQYSRIHESRNQLLEAVASLGSRYSISFRLMCPKWKQLSSRRYFNRIPLPVPYLPETLRSVSGPPVFGRGMYEIFGSSKLVVNAGTDISGKDRGNMRCFEALGCGAGMVSDEGDYPDGLTPKVHFETYSGVSDLIAKVELILTSGDYRESLARAGHQYISGHFSKKMQWENFLRLIESF